jgi:hypothetical protein
MPSKFGSKSGSFGNLSDRRCRNGPSVFTVTVMKHNNSVLSLYALVLSIMESDPFMRNTILHLVHWIEGSTVKAFDFLLGLRDKLNKS